MSTMVGMLRAAANESNGFRYLLIVWFALTTCLIVGTLAVGAPSAAGQPFDLIAGQVEEPNSPSPSGLAASQMYPSMSYAGVTWSVVTSRLIPRTEVALSRPIVVVEAIVSNTTTAAELRVRDSDVAIVWPDGRRDYVDRFEEVDGYRSFTIKPGQEIPVILVFKPQINTDPDMEVMRLEIQEPGRIPASVPLLGPAPAPDFPLAGAFAGALDGARTTIDDPDTVGRQLMIAPLSVSLGVDAGPYRASLGDRIVIAEISVQRSGRATDAAYLQPDFWQLWLGDTPLPATRVALSEDRMANEDVVSLVFVIQDAPDSLESDALALTVNGQTSGEARHVITFPDRR